MLECMRALQTEDGRIYRETHPDVQTILAYLDAEGALARDMTGEAKAAFEEAKYRIAFNRTRADGVAYDFDGKGDGALGLWLGCLCFLLLALLVYGFLGIRAPADAPPPFLKPGVA
jgi:hypothetical protein